MGTGPGTGPNGAKIRRLWGAGQIRMERISTQIQAGSTGKHRQAKEKGSHGGHGDTEDSSAIDQSETSVHPSPGMPQLESL